MNILGITTMTESAAVLMRDGTVIAAAEEERYSRIKHSGGIPYCAIDAVMKQAGVTMREIDVVAVYWNPYALAFRARWMATMALSQPLRFSQKMMRAVRVWQGAHASGDDAGWSSLFRIERKLAKRFGQRPRRVRYIDHHMTHMAAAFFGSPFDEAAILVMDGAGESACTTIGVGRGSDIRALGVHLLPHSLGHFYSSITGYLGFKMLDGEYKLMGLSPYGDPSGAKWIRKNYLVTPSPGHYKLLTRALDYHRALKGDFSGSFSGYFGAPRVRSDTAEFNDRHRDIAASAQRAFEEVVLDLARDLQRRTGLTKLVISGGCGLNCVANGQILRNGIFDEIYVPPVPHDSGGALGAAMYAYQQEHRKRPEPVVHAFFGEAFTNQAIRKDLEHVKGIRFERLEEDQLVDRTATWISERRVIAWFQGAMEYGPRALGNRSFLADPRSDDIRDTINAKIKKRELFRPFAPSVLQERAGDYFEIEQPAPFMTIIVPVREPAKRLIPAVTHVDGTARPQTVSREHNPLYWKLIKRFEDITGVAVLLNTSFNIQEPIVCTPGEALRTFKNSTTDALVLGNYWVTHV